jgi:hypothetical protein
MYGDILNLCCIVHEDELNQPLFHGVLESKSDVIPSQVIVYDTNKLEVVYFLCTRVFGLMRSGQTIEYANVSSLARQAQGTKARRYLAVSRATEVMMFSTTRWMHANGVKHHLRFEDRLRYLTQLRTRKSDLKHT